ncbi:SDR family oxidoreductase [Novosphingobium sp.]|uniref:SDR family NAD(P)-dependent oxidoreductase n=1 Tax=Novosphingobium sp. TaxID=1874826 RepID=UPI0025D69DBB|nr:SDR family oxidoreductase [Novosphingobium sp.]
MSGAYLGKGVVVTGAGGGMGRAIALAFAREGAHVIAADIIEAGLAETRALLGQGDGSLTTMLCDVRDEAGIAALVDSAAMRAGRLDVMVNNAAVLGSWVPIAEQERATLDLVIDVNLKGTVLGMKQALRHMIPARAGVIINLASVQSFRVAYPGAAFYAASKAAVVSLTRSAALENGHHGIRAVAIAPGPIDTPMLRSTGGDWPPPIVEQVPLGRVGEAGEVAAAALWLASDAASYISGATLPVDGGWLAP